MRYCARCVYPDTKPDLTFDDKGVCSSCRAYERRTDIDWGQRKEDFRKIVEDLKSEGREYDCIIPVSGGKDSFYQTVTAIQHGIKPLLVNARTCHLSDLGRKNLDALGRMADIIEIAPNADMRRSINKYTLETIGDISWPEHVLIFTVPIIIAMQRGINTILYGENPQNEYGGPRDWQDKSQLEPTRWLQEFGGMNGLRVSDVGEALKGYTSASWFWYTYPKHVMGLRQLFLGHYMPWDGEANAKFAKAYGFIPYHLKVESSGISYENLDNLQTGIHDYFKYLKYGFGRATDIACSAVKRGRMTRTEAIKHVRAWDGVLPTQYLGVSLQTILGNIGMKENGFHSVCNEFANKELFKTVVAKWPTPAFTLGL